MRRKSDQPAYMAGHHSIILGLFCLYTLNQTLAKPLRRLTAAADKLAVGDTNIELDSSNSTDEIAPYAEVICQHGTVLENDGRDLKACG